MPRMASFLAVALCVALCVQSASARVLITSVSGNTAPINTRTPDTCAADYLFNAAFGTQFTPQTFQSCPADGPGSQRGLHLPISSSTLVAPSSVSTQGYDSTNTYTVTITGRDFDDLSFTVPAPGTQVGTICLGGTDCTGGCAVGIPSRPVFYQSNTQLTFPIQPNGADEWLNADRLLENTPRALCFTNFGATRTINNVFLGLHFGAVYSCQTDAGCGDALRVTGTGLDGRLTELDRRVIQGLSTCAAGQCINANVQGTCGVAGTTYELAAEKCCDGTRGVTQFIDRNCPCRRQIGGGAPVCPANAPECCLPTKFQELIPSCTGPNPDSICFTQVGQCYNPLQQQCCDTGAAFDPGAQQCCSISGIQATDYPCPCETDLDCEGGTTQAGGTRTPNLNQRCCMQTAPELPTGDGAQCTAYQNFPSGQLSFRATRCRGTCFDARFQICCNGATCRREFERCCNATCCNLFTSTCFTSARQAGASGSIANFREFGLRFTRCSSVQNLETISVFWVYVIPAAFLIATLGSLALALVFTSKAAVRMFSLLEKIIIAMGIIVTIISCALYFSPVYKYGIIFSIAAIIAIIAAAARVRWVTILALIAVGLSAWYLLDPWHGNDYLTLAYWRLANGNPDPRTAGLFHSLGNLFPARDQLTDVSINQCVTYYNYFALDPQLQDQTRYNNPAVTTFGYCTRGWITALLVLAGILWASLVFLFALLVLALILRFRKDRSAPIELEVRPEPFLAPMFGAPTAFVDPYAAGFAPAY